MQQHIKQQFPQWVNEKQDRYLLLSNDLDSLLSCTLLNMVQGYKINGYYTFNAIGLIKFDSKKLIGVDVALNNNKLCWDNHVTGLNRNSHFNENSANLNAILKSHAETGYHYTQKMAFSTALQIWSYYDIPLPTTDEGKMMLLSIDSSFLGFYSDRFNSIFKNYMKMLGFEELIQFCERHSKQDFYNFKRQFNEALTLKDGYISYEYQQFVEDCLQIKLYIPEGQFNLACELDVYRASLNQIHDLSRDESVISYAIINKNEVKYSKMNGDN